MKDNLLEAISELAKEKGIDRERVIQIVEETIVAAARKKLSKYNTLEAEMNPKTGQVELFHYKRVTQFPQDQFNEILLEEAQAMDPNAEEGDEVEYEIESREFNRIAQSARQLIFKKIKDVEREIVYDTFQERIGEILTGTVVRTEEGGRVAINFNKTEAYLFRREQIPGERFSHGDHIRVYLMDVSNDPKQASQLVISRTHPGFLIKLFEMEVPEVYDGIVEVKSASREPGKRAKVSVYTADSDVDPVGACVGIRGSRVQAIVSELKGEKIDIVRWSEDLPTYLKNAMAPAEIERMEIDEDSREINVWVEADQLSLAIGRQGQNVRLASKLTNYKINVTSLEERSNMSIEDQLAYELEKRTSQTDESEGSTDTSGDNPSEAATTTTAETSESPMDGDSQNDMIVEEETESQDTASVEIENAELSPADGEESASVQESETPQASVEEASAPTEEPVAVTEEQEISDGSVTSSESNPSENHQNAIEPNSNQTSNGEVEVAE